ncbi:hypothetical protein ONZ45_g4986 [Pleurotus djamor]|nr:hypothetical protein ONZ45_g4986 [Pleurotus djamor]
MLTTKFLAIAAAVFITTPLFSVARPFPVVPLDSLPIGTVRVAFDEANNKLLAFDVSGQMLEQLNPDALRAQKKRAAGSCVDLSSDDVQKLPGWKKIEDRANSLWGTGKRRIVTNDKDFPDKPAQICAGNGPVTLTKDGEPQCSTSKQSTEGKLPENGSVSLAFTQGTDFSSTNTVTKQSSIAIGETLSVELSFAELLTASAQVSTTTEFTNTLSDATSSGGSTSSESTINMDVPANKFCHLDFTSEACNVQGTGRIPFVATGFVWFEFEDKVDGHFKWFLSIDDELPNADDRSTFVEFKSAVSSTTKSGFNGVCDA